MACISVWCYHGINVLCVKQGAIQSSGYISVWHLPIVGGSAGRLNTPSIETTCPSEDHVTIWGMDGVILHRLCFFCPLRTTWINAWACAQHTPTVENLWWGYSRPLGCPWRLMLQLQWTQSVCYCPLPPAARWGFQILYFCGLYFVFFMECTTTSNLI